MQGRSAADAEDFVRRLAEDYRTLGLAAADGAMLDYAMKLTLAPHAIGPEEVATLRSAGFDDRAIHDICAVASYYAFVNRIADGLGVELEERLRTDRGGDG